MKRRAIPLPPPSLRFMNDTDEGFLAVGDQTIALLRSHAGLTPSSSVVDIGSGYGRLAHGFLRWEEFTGRYAGLEILKPHVAWCRKNLSRHARRRFTFRHLDIRNDRYNPRGKLEASAVRLPIDDGSTDVAVLLSVFTHMYPAEITHYLAELARILAPGGRAAATMLLLNADWEALEREGKPTYRLTHHLNEFTRYMKDEDPLHAIGYDESWVRKRVAEAGLAVDGPIIFGSWAGRPRRDSFQDMLILRRA